MKMKMSVVLIIVGWAIQSKQHFIPHSHDDLGWLKTIGEYYQESVHDILTSVISALKEVSLDNGLEPSQKRKFVFGDLGYVKMFLNQNESLKKSKIDDFIELQRNGQWEWVNGGMSQADEACSHYEDVIDNYFYGLRFLRKNFGTTSQAAWQLDPFGHSKAFAFIAAKFGMGHIVLARLSASEREKRIREGSLQFRWVFPDGTSIVVHSIRHYNAYDPLRCDKDCDISKFKLEEYTANKNEYNQGYRYDTFALVGDDFTWSEASPRFKFTDFVLQQDQSTVYSLWSEYRQAFEAQAKDLPSFNQDLYVYEDDNGDSWSGYFITKPRLKLKNRETGKMLRALRSLAFTSLKNNRLSPDRLDQLASMAEDFGVLLHHDTITGTSMLKVDDDYHFRYNTLAYSIALFLNESLNSKFKICDFNDVRTGTAQCQFDWNTNEIYVRLYNPAPHAFKNIFEVHLLKSDLTVKEVVLNDRDKTPVEFDFLCGGQLYCSLYFQAQINAHSLHIYKITLAKGDSSPLLSYATREVEASIGSEVKVGDYVIIVSDSNIEVRHFGNQPFVNNIYYTKIDSHEGGHYVTKFSEDKTFQVIKGFKSIRMMNGKVIQIADIIGDEVSLRFTHKKYYMTYSIESTVHKTAELDSGFEVQLNIQSNITPSEEYVTDSNGLFEMKRKNGQKIETSIFPMTRFIDIKDSKSDRGLRIYSDRSQGAKLDKNGAQIWIQKTSKVSDKKGNPEVLKAESTILTRHVIWNYAKSNFNSQTRAAIFDLLETSFLLSLSLNVPEDKSFSPEIKSNLKFIRITFDVIDENSFQIRAQNLLDEENNKVDFKLYLKEMFSDYNAKEVDFNYITQPIDKHNEREVADSYDLKPLEFVTFLLTKQ